MKYIAENWLSYKSMTLPKDMSEREMLEAKMGFYAGSIAIFQQLMNSAQNPATTQDQGEKLLDDIGTEIAVFTGLIQAKDLDSIIKD